jgi:molecular chaperone DnaK (HSP70)
MRTKDRNETPSRFVVGIDLGTTNSAAAYVDSHDPDFPLRDLQIPQMVAPATIEPRETLPSFHYEAATGEFAAGALQLPWDTSPQSATVGVLARDHGALVPGRLISSAKSWLCNARVDRIAGILPWHGAADVQRLSPVDVSARYLSHLRAAWDHKFPADPLHQQEVILTVPASFDEVARELTIEASKKAGLSQVVLVEEPQAAFYAWLHEHRARWESEVQPGQTILICDIGGGTTDFTLIRVQTAAGGKVQFHRVAVGEHLILGGDNLDLALAHYIERKIAGDAKLDPRRWAPLVRLCRSVKETLLGKNPPPNLTLHLVATGSKLIAGATQVILTREEAHQVLLEGFLPAVELSAKPATHRSGFQELGLPYAPDPAISKYLAAFLTSHREAKSEQPFPAARPDIVLFNGGFFESPQLSQRLLDILSDWFSVPGEPRWKPKVLPNARLDLAVSRGAAHYGMVRRGHGERISGGSAQTYYIGVESTDSNTPSVVCLLPAGLEEGQGVDLTELPFNLLIRQPVEFPLYVSSVRTTDIAGQIVPVDPLQMTALPPIRTVLQSGRKGAADSIAVTLHARRTEIGTLELWCAEQIGDRKWKLQFDVRMSTIPGRDSATGEAEALGFVDQSLVESCSVAIRHTFQPDLAHGTQSPDGLIKQLELITAIPRTQWPPTLMRSFWEQLLPLESARRISLEHEARWLNLLGYSLRPGYGLAVDDWRVAQTWKLQPSKVFHDKNEQCRAEWWILGRRVAGGLTQGQQHTLAEPLLASLRTYLRKAGTAKGSALEYGPHEGAEVFRLLGALELLKTVTKIEIGNILLQFISRNRSGALQDAALWAMGRLATRVPIYGPLNMMIPPETAEAWIEKLLALPQLPPKIPFSLMLMSRLTGDRYRDISPPIRLAVRQKLVEINAPSHYLQLVESGGELADEEQRIAFGENLPRGLRIQ